MVKRKRLKEDACPVARALDVVGDRWTLLIIRDAFDNRRRFSDFQRSLDIAKNILTDRLRTLVDEGMLAMLPHSAQGQRLAGQDTFVQKVD